MLHITRGKKIKKKPNEQTKEVALPESFHKAHLEIGALLKLYVQKMC